MMHISDFTAVLGNPAKLFLWDILIPALPVGSIKAQSAQFPGVGTTDIDLFHNGQLAKFPGAVEYDHIWNCTIVESESGDVYNAMSAWVQLTADQKLGIQADVSAYKRDITLSMITSAGSSWYTLVLKQAYPKNIDTLDIDKSANTEAVKWSCNFNYDWWEPVGGGLV